MKCYKCKSETRPDKGGYQCTNKDCLVWFTEDAIKPRQSPTVDINGVEYPPDALWGKTIDITRPKAEKPRIHRGKWFNLKA